MQACTVTTQWETGNKRGYPPWGSTERYTEVIERLPQPEDTLLQYIRRKLLLPGTKEGCGHGGCGSCTVMVSKMDYETKRIRHYTVNACLFPVCAAHGLAVTTVEGVGNPKTGLHDVQKRLIESHGLQCGFCTPGFVMSVFTLLRNNPKPTRNDIEKAIEGNLCRCTGYRPIVQAFNTLCQDPCPQGELCCKNKKSSQKQEQPTNVTDQTSSTADDSQVAIFPAELQLSNRYSVSTVTFKGQNWTWIRPTTFDELLSFKDKYPDAPVIMGNTMTAWYLKEGRIKGNCLIYGGGIPSLKTAEIKENDGIVLGAGLTINEMQEKLKALEPLIPEEKRRHFPALHLMIEKYGAEQIRNTATLGGSIMSGRSNSDITTILAGLNAFVVLQSVSSESNCRIESLPDKIKTTDIVKSVIVPFTNKYEHIMFYKQSDRRSFSLALLNSCMFVRLSGEGQVEALKMCFGGIDNKLVVRHAAPTADEWPSWLAERKWNNKLLENVLSCLPDILKGSAEQALDKYKLAVAAGFFYKFFCYVMDHLTGTSIGRAMLMEPCCGTQTYESFTDPNQNAKDPLHRPVPNVSSEAVVSGQAGFVDDIPKMAGELFLALVTSKMAHAKIVKVDPTDALSVPGVHGFIDHRNIPGENRIGIDYGDEELFASQEVMFYGQPVGAVVAETREIARKAASRVAVEYEELKRILTMEDAIKEKSFFDVKGEISTGDVEDGFEKSDHVIDGAYKTGYQEHFYMEPWSCLVVPRVENEEMDIIVGSQKLVAIQEGVSRVLGVACHKISCSVKRLGGGFGGKAGRVTMVAGPAAIAAQKFGCPVRCVLSREVDMEITGKRHPLLGQYKVGVLKNGKIKALDIQVYADAGNSLGPSAVIYNKIISDFDGCYHIENLRFNGFLCKTNTPSNIPCRGFGSAEGLVIMEDIIFNIACTLNVSQQQVREVNLSKKDDLMKYGIPMPNCSVRELWDKCRKQSHYVQREKDIETFNKENRWTKRGIVMTAEKYIIGWPKMMYQGTAVISIYMDGTVLLTHGGIDMGQGINTKMIQIASKELGIPQEFIYVSDSNTKATPNSVVTAGSMGTDIYGPAVMDACKTMSERLKPLRDANPDMPWKDLIEIAFFNRVKLTATGFSRYPKVDYDPVTKTGSKIDYYIYGVVCTEVEIDVLTGENLVLQADIVMDVGKSLNPAIDVGQIEGAFVMGQGMVTSEYIDLDSNGKMINCSPLSYKIPNVRCVPRKFNVTLERADSIETQVYSAKAVGEPPLLLSISVIMAIKEAIKAARVDLGLSGYFRLDSPATVEKIRLACGDQLKKVEK